MNAKFALLGATAMAGALFIGFGQGSQPAPGRDVAELLDPRTSLKSVCQGLGKNRLAAFFSMAQANAAKAAPAGPMPIFDGMGDFSFAVSTDVAMAQAYFDQGLKFTYNFHHAAAARSFQAAQAADPSCAMCYWGEALVLGPNINSPMNPADNAAALKALAAAVMLSGEAMPAEQALIAALKTRYSADPQAERAVLDAAYADAMMAAAENHPEIDEIQILAAEAAMDTQPWDYWQGDGTPKGRAGAALALVETVLERSPNNPGAIHLYIHMTEASPEPERAEPYADRLAELMPGAGHIVHMPAHLYYRIGRYVDSLETNIDAIAADEAYFARAGREGIYGFGYYPHNVHFVLVSAQRAGDRASAIAMADKLGPLVPADVAIEMAPFAQPIAASPYFVHAQFSDPKTVLTLDKPDPRMPYVQAMWHYARGVALAAQEDLDAAEAEAAAIAGLRETGDFSALTGGGVPAANVLEIAELVLAARIAQADRDHAGAITAFAKAVAVQDTLPYMEPPYWYYPVRQSLGAALLAAGQADEAVRVLRRSLFEAPNGGYALYALAAAEAARGDAAAAAAARTAFKAAWAGSGTPDLDRM